MGIHSSRDVPPTLPLFTGSTSRKRDAKDALQETIVSTAAAVVKAVGGSSPVIQSPSINQSIQDIRSTVLTPTPTRLDLGVSPGKAADIRSKSFGQLATLKSLYEDQVLTQEEFEEQKSIILSGLKKLQ